MSRKHLDDLKALNSKEQERWGKTAEYLKNLPKCPNWPDLPLVKTKNSNDFYCCFGCKNAWVNQPYNHLGVSKECVAGHAKMLHYLSGVVSEEDRVKSLEQEVLELKKQLADTTSGKVVLPSGDPELQEKYDALKAEMEDVEETTSMMMGYRALLKKLFGERFPTRVSGDEEMKLLEKMVDEMNTPPPSVPKSAPEPVKVAPKFNEAKVGAYLAAHTARDLKTQNEVATSFNDADWAEAIRRVNEAPKPSATIPTPVGTAVLLSTTLRRGKVLDRERAPQPTR